MLRSAAIVLLLLLAAAGAAAAEQPGGSGATAEPDATEGPPSESTQEAVRTRQITEEIVVAGSRARRRSATESLVPVNVLSGDALTRQGETSLDMLLRNVAPTVDISSIDGDGATVVRPINFRGLAPDHSLVLVNGHRRHRGAVIIWSQIGVSHGAQGPDLTAIPAIALRRVELLSDGASAQYGSDAIGGVVNFLLKDDRSGGSVEVMAGGYGEGGGESMTLAGNAGFPLGASGFFNVSLEYGESAPSNRTVQRADAALLVAAGNTHVADPAQRWGVAEIDNDVKLWANFAGEAFRGLEFHGHANYSSRRVSSRNFFFRNPNTRAAVFSNDGGRTLLIGDLSDARDGVLDGSAGCPVAAVTNARPDPVALERVFADPDCFSFQEMFPGGFQPLFGGDRVDAALLAGLRGQTSGGTGWDFSVSLGAHEVDFFLIDSVNASLGPDTPTSFRPGSNRQQDLGVNLDLTRQAGRQLHLAAGAEWRRERFEIGLGEPDSWRIGPLAAQGFSAGSNGFPGFSPIAAGQWSRANSAIYGDAELTPQGRPWALGAALRFEHYDDFGSTLNGKLAGRVEISRNLAARGSVSTGFRAPTPGQQNAFNVSTQWDVQRMELFNNGTIPSTSRVAALRGGEALDAEKSLSFALGAVFESEALVLAADIYRIDVRDRLGVTGLFTLQPDEVSQLLAEGITSAANLTNFRFFANDFETRTEGLDMVGTWRHSGTKASGLSGGSRGGTRIEAALSLLRTRVTEHNPQTLDAARIRELEEALPRVRFKLTAERDIGRVNLLARLSHYGGWYDTRDSHAYGGATLLDVELALKLGERVRVMAGGRNALNRRAARNPNPTVIGNLYSGHAPFDVNGGFYYARLQYRWDD